MPASVLARIARRFKPAPVGPRRLPGAAGRRPVLLALLVAVLLLLPGCPEREKAGEQQVSPQVRVAVSLAGAQEDANRIMRQAMESRARQEKLSVTWLDAGGDAAVQERQLRELAGKVAAVVVQPVDPAGIKEALKRLAGENVKVVALEQLPADAPVDAFVSFDRDAAGRLAASLLQQAGEKGGGVLFLGPKGGACREVLAAARKALGGLRLLEEVILEKDEAGAAEAAVRQALEKYGARLGGVLAVGSRAAAGALAAVKEAGAQERVVTVGVGAGREAWEALVAGEHDGEVDTRPDLLGSYALEAALELARGGYWPHDARVPSGSYSVPARIVPVRLIRRENAYLLAGRWGEGGGAQGARQPEPAGRQGGEGRDEGHDEGRKEEEKPRTILRITTREGRVLEVEVPGEIERIESTTGGGAAGAGGARTDGG
ncbi:sugar ABC transporter substrate-binding protein [Desulfovirgula thermocuniculi]|uniref:sugar ABC transporter substrate-binding protein n=1 Tax=Desulfovirgula thermocuniculi TaxID=348842 RepID=UPI0003FD62D8|nr:substrate-binding domain-containing protein [Desulfovirgula thermocuniculi]